MKKIFLLIVTTVITLNLFAQDEHKNDTTKIKWGNSKIWIFPNKEMTKRDSIKKARKGNDFSHWRGFDIGICALTTAQNQFMVPQPDAYNTNDFLNLKYSRSWFFSLNLFEKNIRIYKNYLTLITGLGLEWNSYNFNNKIILNPDSTKTNSTTIKTDTSSVKYIKNQLKAAYLKIPLLLDFNTNTLNAKKSFHIAAGMEFGYKISSWTKQKFVEDGNTFKVKRHADYNLDNFKYSFVVRAGYGAFTLFANYTLSTLFDKDKGPEIPIYPLSTGITISF